MDGPTDKRTQLLILSVPLVLLVSLVAASTSCDVLAWSLLPFLDIPTPWAIVLASVPFAALLWCFVLGRSDGARSIHAIRLTSLQFDALVLVGSIVLFLWLTPRTFFLGDGYLVLGNLSKANPVSKGHDYVIVWLLEHLRDLLGDPTRQTALLAFRVLSVACGAVTTTAILLCSRSILADEMRRRVFVLLSVSGGSSLLFFGYVEYYSLLCLVNTAYCMSCLLIVHDALPRWVIIPLLLAALVLHPVSLYMVPSACLVLSSGRIRGKLSCKSPWLLVFGLTVLITIAYLIVSSLSVRHAALRFAVLPITSNWYTVDAYTLVSLKHVLDYANLILLLTPSVLLVPFCLFAVHTLPRRATIDRLFLVLLFPALMLAFLLDPKLGMPRDWDLFSFAGAPLLLALAYYTSHHVRHNKVARAAAVVGIALQVAVLCARALLLTMPDPSIKQTKRYLLLDPGRSRVGHVLIAQHYLENGDTASFRREERERQHLYPAEQFAWSAQRHIERGNAAEGRIAAAKAIQLNPRIWEAWINLGRSLRLDGRYDSSLICLQIADGLNPSSFLVQVELGMAYLKVGDSKAAEDAWLTALDLDSTHFITYGALGSFYANEGDSTRMEHYLKHGLNQSDYESWAVVQLATYYRRTERRTDCLSLVSLLRDRSADSSLIQQITEICAQP